MPITPRSAAYCAIAGFAYLFLLDWVYHGMLLAPAYTATAELWRSPESMRAFMPFYLLSALLFATVGVYLFAHGYKGTGSKEGVKFGFYLGALLTALHLCAYAHMPIPANILLAWIGVDFLKTIGLGVIYANLHNRF